MHGGVLHPDLVSAAQAALKVPREQARERALSFGWEETARLFLSHLVNVATGSGIAFNSSHGCHIASSKSTANLTY